jgi:release factor H-coupled RctB family protein
MGNAVICDDKKLLYEEAPQAYKNIDRIIKELEKAELIEVIATLSPIITYKRRDGNGTIITGEFRARP